MRLHVNAALDDPFRPKWRDRVDQCIELLRHKLMCEGDATLNLMWRNPERATGEGVDLSTKHKCRDYNRIVNWANRNAWGR